MSASVLHPHPLDQVSRVGRGGLPRPPPGHRDNVPSTLPILDLRALARLDHCREPRSRRATQSSASCPGLAIAGLRRVIP